MSGNQVKDVLVDDSNPTFFNWVGSTWANYHTDPETPLYFNSSFHSTTTNNDYVTFNYTGSDFQLFGGQRDNHGVYGVSVDNGPVRYYSGYLAQDSIPSMLFSTSGLNEGLHSVVVWNKNANSAFAGRIYFDLDFVIYNPGPSNSTPTSTTQNLASVTNFPTNNLGWNPPIPTQVDQAATYSIFSAPPDQTSITSAVQSGHVGTQMTGGPTTSARMDAANASEASSSDMKHIISIVIPLGLASSLLVALGAFGYVWWRRRKERRMYRLPPSSAGIPSRLWRGTGWTRSIHTTGASTNAY